ncbi:Sec-independent protein translocase protein TatC [Actinoplanes capillaceus]|uniref:Sec-independent protein translocase protein TatC n=1 Tax=Actinoplanes campanulatus TaxID=113559 RepID=A0ABQ3WP45_9ACTN|nr:twin-arginine translocase subunit TatC [Actinoplanes capillaceus]GID47982.1 Sec-independent protein translocase protein TatC [Actinoplanes capillaceus]
MALSLWKKTGPSKFEQAADGSMTLIEHVKELRDRLFLASLGLIAGLIVGFVLSQPTFDLLKEPYCSLPGAIDANGVCKEFVQLSPATGFIIKLKISLWVGIVVSAPVWLYQLWAFIAPGLHRHERKWAYVFVALAAPLFAGGAILAYAVVDKGLEFLLDAGVTGAGTTLEASAYVDFVTNMILLFGVAFEFPLILLMLNFTGVASAKRLLSWWRIVVFLSFAFAAIATPDPGPFGMTLLAAALSALYFVACGVAFINDRRKGRGREIYAGLDDDELSPLDEERVPVGASDPIESPTAIEAPTPVDKPMPIERRFDDMT